MRFPLAVPTAVFAVAAFAVAADAPDGWSRWRGPNDDGMARGDAPLQWSDKEHIAWKAEVPGRGNSSPVVWGDRIFLTTAVPTGKAPAAPPLRQAPSPVAGRRRGGGPQSEHRFAVLAYDRKTGKLLWDKTARDRHAARRPSRHLRQFRLKLAGRRWQTRHRLLRFARGLLLYARRAARLGEGLWHPAENVQRLRRGRLARVGRKHAGVAV